jgi:hypothetical protein
MNMEQKRHLKIIRRSLHEENAEVKDHFKTVVRDVIISMAGVLDQTWALWEIDPSSEDLREKFSLLEYYLDYLKRFLEEEV